MTTTRHDLDIKVRNLNRALGYPEEPWTKGADDKYHPNAGNISLSGAYGGWQVVQMRSTSGETPLLEGYWPRAHVAAFLDGMAATLRVLLPVDEYGRVTSWDVDYQAVPRELVAVSE